MLTRSMMLSNPQYCGKLEAALVKKGSMRSAFVGGWREPYDH